MVELYNVLRLALHGYSPLDSMRYEKEYSWQCLRQIQRCLLQHEGEMALFMYKDGKKEIVPRLVQIYQVIPCGIVLRYKCYDPEGHFRQYLTRCVTLTDIFCGDAQLELFGNI